MRAKAAPMQILVCSVTQNQIGRCLPGCLGELSGSWSNREVMSWNSGPRSEEGEKDYALDPEVGLRYNFSI